MNIRDIILRTTDQHGLDVSYQAAEIIAESLVADLAKIVELENELRTAWARNASLIEQRDSVLGVLEGLMKPECDCFAGCKECENSTNYFEQAHEVIATIKKIKENSDD